MISFFKSVRSVPVKKIIIALIIFLLADILVFITLTGLVFRNLININGKNNYRLLTAWSVTGRWLSLTKWRNLPGYVPEAIGCYGRKTYFILLQNRYELRPSGGIMGSYARLNFDGCNLKEINIQDIYEPDGQIQGHVDPPQPIQDAFKQGWYRLRDANWDPDFSRAGEVIAWFFEKGNEAKADGIIGINFGLVTDMLRIIGPLEVADYDYTINADNFYSIVQETVEADFFPGSKQKPNFLSALYTSFQIKIRQADLISYLKLYRALLKNITDGEIVAYFVSPDGQKLADSLGLSGRVVNKVANNGLIYSDYFYFIESNLGANKANCCTQRNILLAVNQLNSKITRQVTVKFTNNSLKEPPGKPLLYGGPYLDYQRLAVPIDVSEFQVEINGDKVPVEKIDRVEVGENNIATYGFWLNILPESTAEVKIEYSSPINRHYWLYRVYYRHQPGVPLYGLQVSSGNGLKPKVDTAIDRSQYFWLTI